MTNEDLKRFFPQSVNESKDNGFARYDDLGKLPYLPILQVDLNNFTQMTTKTYYKHIGISSSSFTNDIVYYYDGTNFLPLTGGGSGTGVHILPISGEFSTEVGLLRKAKAALKTSTVIGIVNMEGNEYMYLTLIGCALEDDGVSNTFVFIAAVSGVTIAITCTITNEQADDEEVAFEQTLIGAQPVDNKIHRIISFFDTDFQSNNKHLILDFVTDTDGAFDDADIISYIKSCLTEVGYEGIMAFNGHLNMSTLANVTDVSKCYAFINESGLTLGIIRYGDVNGVYGIKSTFTPIVDDTIVAEYFEETHGVE